MLFATVTPSLVTLGPPKLCSITTLRPLKRIHSTSINYWTMTTPQNRLALISLILLLNRALVPLKQKSWLHRQMRLQPQSYRSGISCTLTTYSTSFANNECKKTTNTRNKQIIHLVTLGPMVTLTASASSSTPLSITARASTPNLMSLAA